MIWVLFIVVAVLLVGVFAAMVAGRVSYDPMAAPVTTQPDTGLTEDFVARDVATVHFDTALRGYRMDQVDGVLDRLQDRLAEQEHELAALRAPTGRHAAVTPEPPAERAAEPSAEPAAQPPAELAAEPSVEVGAEQPTESRAGESRG
ncbi:MAG TPA: DivIVA domain-containing protein [Pedococcus sp.]|nr:DivIVA domain-containing protein [Pedococcus sp.]